MTTIYKYFFIGVIGLVILTVFLLSSGVVNPSWNPFLPHISSAFVQDSLSALTEIKKMRINGFLEMNFQNMQYISEQSLSPQKVNLFLQFNHLIDYLSPEQRKNATDIKADLKIDDMPLSLAVEMIGAQNVLYLKINELPEYLPLGIEVEKLTNQWFLVDPLKLGLSSQATSTIERSKQINNAFLQEVQKIISAKDLFYVKRYVGQETIDNTKTKHYVVSLRPKEVKELLPELFNIFSKYANASEMNNYKQDFEKTRQSVMQNFDQIWKEINGIDFDLWITIDNPVVKKIKIAKKIDNNSLNGELNFSDFNKGFVIEIPQQYTPIENIFPPEWLGEITTSTLPLLESEP